MVINCFDSSPQSPIGFDPRGYLCGKYWELSGLLMVSFFLFFYTPDDEIQPHRLYIPHLKWSSFLHRLKKCPVYESFSIYDFFHKWFDIYKDDLFGMSFPQYMLLQLLWLLSWWTCELYISRVINFGESLPHNGGCSNVRDSLSYPLTIMWRCGQWDLSLQFFLSNWEWDSRTGSYYELVLNGPNVCNFNLTCSHHPVNYCR